MLFSERVGCQRFLPLYHGLADLMYHGLADLTALCLRSEKVPAPS